MSAYSVNQVRQLYVVNAEQTAFTALANPGDIIVGHDNSGHIYLKYVGALGDTMRSDLMKVSSIKYAKATKASDMAYKLKRVTVTLDSDVNAGVPVAGQDYLLRLAFREFIGVSPADQYFMYGMVHAVTGMDASTFYKKMAISLAKNMSKEVNPLVTVYVIGNSSAEIEITPSTKEDDLTSHTVTGIRIYEAGQPWHLGIMPQGVIPFEVQFPRIIVDGDSREWGTKVEEESTKTLPQGQKVADLEWFAMGERGDQYRLVGWPNVIPTKYMVDPSKNYDIITIHYWYEGPNEQAQKSEKDIQIAVPAPSGAYTSAPVNELIKKINAALGAVDPDKANMITALA